MKIDAKDTFVGFVIGCVIAAGLIISYLIFG